MRFRILSFLFVLALAQNVFAVPQALLVSLEQYAKDEHKLKYVESDIKDLGGALTDRLGFQIQTSKDLTVSPSDTSDSRYRDAALKLINDWVVSVPENETALVYLAGHGVKGKDDKLYWVMNNFDENKWAETTIAVVEVREILKKCKAKHKLLLLDACHSGDAKDLTLTDSRTIETEETAQELNQDLKIPTIASSSEEQVSWLWPEMKHSLFTYWLIMALNGAADTNGDSKITYSELKDYLLINVTATATKLEKSQCPTFLNEDALDESFLLEEKAFQLEPMFDFLARQIDAQMRVFNLNRLAIPEFSSGESFNYVDGSVALMTKSASDKLRQKLRIQKNITGAPYDILDENATEELLKTVKRSEIGTSKTKDLMPQSSEKDGGDAAILVGNIQRYSECGLIFSCKLITQSGGSKAEFKTIALLMKPLKNTTVMKPDYEEIGMTGPSFVPPSPLPKKDEKKTSSANSEKNKNQANEEIPNEKTKHPLADENLTSSLCSVEIRTRPAGSKSKFEKKEFRFNENRCDVTIQKGEEYEIRLLNNCGEELFAKVLVDGLNTLPQKINEQWVFHPRTSIKEARSWLITKNTKSIAIRGFYIPAGLDFSTEPDQRGILVEGKREVATYYRFTVKDANESYAGRDGFTEQLGIITVAIYNSVAGRSAGGRSSTGTGGGEAGTAETVEVYQGPTHPGTLKMLVNIHYSSNE